ncbi:hypothetical protein ACGFJT_31780 [Actinomadura geliboluensis]|uniref:hypothetical protein n=1 Tax=Actinomadura geliboluensis TaxID=882440 RepID=UPI003723919E
MAGDGAPMNRVVVLGGYGAVGREVVAGLRGHVPEIVVADAAFRHVHVGGDGFAVAVASGGRVRSFAERRQSRATGLAAALVVRRPAGAPAGVRHIEDVAGPGFLPELAARGFALGEYDAR